MSCAANCVRSRFGIWLGAVFLSAALHANAQQSAAEPTAAAPAQSTTEPVQTTAQPAPQPSAEPAPHLTPEQNAAGQSGSTLVTDEPPEDPKSAEKAKKGDDDAPVAGATRTLPADIPPNPPDKDELAAKGETWKGEYETDKDGKVLLGQDAKPLPVLYNRKGKRMHSRYKSPKTHPISIVNGTLTVDGWTGKAQLNYDIADLKFIYLSAPSLGTLVVSQKAFPGSVEQKAAFSGSTLTVTAGDHQMQLASDKPLVGKTPLSAYVHFDPTYTQDPRYPVMGYGDKSAAPYDWPGAKPAKEKGVAADAPPLPESMRPKLAATPVCIAQAGHPCAAKSAAAPAPESAPTGTPAAAPVQ